MPNSRHAERKSARIRVRFWRPGEPEVVRQGYTTNISGTGAFVQTDHPHPKGRRLQVEFSTERNGFVCEALVARAIKTAPELHSARPSGMGLRFLSVDELLAGFLPSKKPTRAASATAVDASTALARASEQSGAGALEGSAVETSEPPATETSTQQVGGPQAGEIDVTKRRVTRQHPAAPPPRKEPEPRPSHDVAPGSNAADPAPKQPEPLTFRLSPPNLDVMRALFDRQIDPGVLLLPSRTDCEVGRPVRVEVKTPASPIGQRILAFEGEVLECGHVDSRTGASLRVKIRENATALDFLRRILDSPPI